MSSVKHKGSSNRAISNARAEMQGGTTAVVSYERNFGDEAMRETRVWSHGERGWTCIHFHRVPL